MTIEDGWIFYFILLGWRMMWFSYHITTNSIIWIDRKESFSLSLSPYKFPCSALLHVNLMSTAFQAETALAVVSAYKHYSPHGNQTTPIATSDLHSSSLHDNRSGRDSDSISSTYNNLRYELPQAGDMGEGATTPRRHGRCFHVP